MAVGLDPVTGIYTYADGSTYQNPVNYGTSEKPQWSLSGSEVAGIMGYDTPANPQGTSPTVGAWGAGDSGGGGAAAPNYTKPQRIESGGDTGSSGNAGYTQGQNPYLYQMGDALVQQNTQNFNRNVMPRIGSAAMATNGYGGSRQGVVEANAINDLNTTNANALANLYGNGFNTALQYDLGRRNNDLGMGNLGLGYAGLDRQIANDNMSWRQQGYNNNMGLWGQMMNNNQTGIGAGTNIQNNPLNYWQQFGNQYNSIGQGYGTQTSNGGGGNPIMGALGGAQLGGQIANWWNGGGSGNATTANGYGNGTMSDLQGYGVF